MWSEDHQSAWRCLLDIWGIIDVQDSIEESFLLMLDALGRVMLA